MLLDHPVRVTRGTPAGTFVASLPILRCSQNSQLVVGNRSSRRGRVECWRAHNIHFGINQKALFYNQNPTITTATGAIDLGQLCSIYIADPARILSERGRRFVAASRDRGIAALISEIAELMSGRECLTKQGIQREAIDRPLMALQNCRDWGHLGPEVLRALWMPQWKA